MMGLIFTIDYIDISHDIWFKSTSFNAQKYQALTLHYIRPFPQGILC